MAKRKRGKIVANGGDHCETPSIAYADVAPFVTELARHILPPSASDTAKAAAGMTQEQQLRAQVQLYDPYYCAGGALRRLAAIGFTRVHNRQEDFYAVLKKGKVPDHDILLSNPPFSADHPQRALHFAACGSRRARARTHAHAHAHARGAGGGGAGAGAGAGKESSTASRCRRRPWLLLLPNHTMHQPWFMALMEQTGEHPLFLCPAGKYKFHAFYDLGDAKGRSSGAGAGEAGATGEVVTPCHTLWYIGGLDEKLRAHMIEWWQGREQERRRQQLQNGASTICTLAQSAEQLPKSLRKLDRYTKGRVERKQRRAKKKKQRL